MFMLTQDGLNKSVFAIAQMSNLCPLVSSMGIDYVLCRRLKLNEASCISFLSIAVDALFIPFFSNMLLMLCSYGVSRIGAWSIGDKHVLKETRLMTLMIGNLVLSSPTWSL